MSTIIKFELKELRHLANDKNSCVAEKKVTQNLALQPWCLGNLKESIKNLLDYKIGKFDKEFNGILLSYKNLRILQNVGTIRNDNTDIQFQVQADYFLFCPHVGATLKGVVNKKNTSHLGILVHRVFNVVILRPTEEPGNKWIGTSVQEGQEVVFRIVVLDLYGALPYIRGELDERWLKTELPGEDEENEMKPVEPVDVSYIDFDKTKPNIQKQMGDGLPQLLTKSVHKNITSKQMTSTTCPVTVSESPLKLANKKNIKLNNVDSNAKSAEKYKRQSKTLQIDKLDQAPRQPKKHKKDD